MKMYAYDIEIYPTFFSVVFIDIHADKNLIKKYIEADIKKDDIQKRKILSKIDHKIFTITMDNNDSIAIMNFVKSGNVLVGYNNFGYDDYILEVINYYTSKLLHSAITNTILYNFSQHIINYNGYNLRRDTPILKGKKKPFFSIDLFKLLYLDKSRISLKQVCVATKWHRVQDLPYNFDKPVEEEEFSNILDYNINDVLATRHLYWTEHKEVSLRVDIAKLYNIPCLSSSRSRISDQLLAKFYSDFTGLNYLEFSNLRTHRTRIKVRDCIVPHIKFNGDVKITAERGRKKEGTDVTVYDGVESINNLNDFIEDLKKNVIGTTRDIDYRLIINETGYTFKSGGLHSIDRVTVEKSTDKYHIIDCDVSSYYPSLVINHKIKPSHLSDHFIDIAEMVVKERIEAKKRKNESSVFKVKAEALKIVANAGFFGKFGSDYSFTKDMKSLVMVTFNGELYLLMLVEQLERVGIKVISANTDGIVCKIPYDKLDEYYSICEAWSTHTKLNLEYVKYSRYVRQDVNNYCAIDTDGIIKVKGIFDDSIRVNKGYNMPIISTALIQYYLFDRPVKETIMNCKDIYSFCISQKTGSTFVNEFHTSINGKKIIENLQKNIRYYVTTKGGGYLYKKYRNKDKRITLLKNRRCVVFNDFYYSDNYNIDYNFYIAQARAVIDKVSGNITAKMKKETGKLFDI